MEQARLDRVPETSRISDWKSADRHADTLAILGNIKDYTPLLEFSNLRHLSVVQANQQQLDLISRLTQLEKLGVYCRPSITSLDSLAKLQNLRVLSIEGNLKDVSLEPIGDLIQLRVLSLAALVSSAVNGNMVHFESFAPLARLRNLEYLELFAVRTRDGSLEPLTHLKSLVVLQINNSYSLEEYARLAVALPDTKGIFQTPYNKTTGSEYVRCKKCGGTDLVVLFGVRRGAITCASCDREKLDMHVAKFNQLKQMFADIG